MPTECNPELFDFARVEGRAVVAAFDGGRITSDAGALLLGATYRVIADRGAVDLALSVDGGGRLLTATWTPCTVRPPLFEVR